jgi:type IV pilus assembly protein PilA
MKKQSGFTLIELMVVMAIIAILATAGLSAYTGYIKKARDTTRIADLGAINTIVLGQMGATGLPLLTAASVNAAILSANNTRRLADPQE